MPPGNERCDEASGLSEAEARLRLARDGPNRLPPPQHRTMAMAALAVLRQPMVLLLLSCTALYAVLGNAFDSAVLAVSVLVVAAISMSQELRTQHVLEALRDLSSPRSTVVRGGVMHRIASVELVEGDLLIVQEGDRMACDADLIRPHSVRTDESLLTGESAPIDKDTESAAARRLHAGTLVVQGDGIATVCATGSRTALGRIGGSLAAIAPPRSRLQEELQRLVRAVAVGAVAVCLLATTVFAWHDGSWTAGLLVGLTLAMAIVPEEFAVVWTVMLALGAWRLAKAHVLTRQPQAIETLGATTVLCVDKTGTLTHNRMELVALHDGVAPFFLAPEGLAAPDRLMATAVLASTAESLDPMDQAILRRAGPVAAVGQLVHREGVQPGRPFVRQVWRQAGTMHVALKGAPEAVLARCSARPELQALREQAELWGSQGWRVVAVARTAFAMGDAAPQRDYECLGLLAFADPLRGEVPAAIQACRRGHGEVVAISGLPSTRLPSSTAVPRPHHQGDAHGSGNLKHWTAHARECAPKACPFRQVWDDASFM
jgi:Ca2+-transporting ATPase